MRVVAGTINAAVCTERKKRRSNTCICVCVGFLPNSLFGVCFVVLQICTNNTMYVFSVELNSIFSLCTYGLFGWLVLFDTTFVQWFLIRMHNNIEQWHRICLVFMVNNAETITLILSIRFFSSSFTRSFLMFFFSSSWSQQKIQSHLSFYQIQWKIIIGAHWSHFICLDRKIYTKQLWSMIWGPETKIMAATFILFNINRISILHNVLQAWIYS